MFEFGALGLGFFGALSDGDDLRRGIVLALVPAGAFGGDRLQPAVGQFGIARDRLRFDADLGERGAVLGDDVVDLGEPGFEIGGGRQRVKRGFGLVARRRWPRRGRRWCVAAPLSAPRCAPRCG